MNISKRLCALTAAIVLSVGLISGYAEEGETVPAAEPEEEQQESVAEPSSEISLDDAVRELEEQAEQEQQEQQEQQAEQGEQPEQSSEGETQEAPAQQTETDPINDPYRYDAESTSLNVTPYAERLREIGEEQRKLDEQIKESEEKLEKNEETAQLYLEYLTKIRDRAEVIESYVARLEVSMNENKLQLERKQKEIDTGIDAFKKRLRALYLSGGGNDSYLSVLLSSKDFYDVMMRMELVKRIAEHDDGVIDSLTKAKEELEEIKAELDAKQAEYDRQLSTLDDLERTYDALLARNKTVREMLEEQMKELEEKNEAYVKERQQFESNLSDVLRSSYGSSSGDTERLAAELEANEALDKLHSLLEGRELTDGQCRYVFKWPVPGYYYISSGVGARWGRYHKGIDIPGPKGT